MQARLRNAEQAGARQAKGSGAQVLVDGHINAMRYDAAVAVTWKEGRRGAARQERKRKGLAKWSLMNSLQFFIKYPHQRLRGLKGQNMIKCDNCGWIGEHKDLIRVEETTGEFWGISVSETMYYCPSCGGDCLVDYIEEKLKEYWVSAYSLITGNQFGASFEAVDEDDMLDQFDKKYPECEIADYGCWDDYIEEENDKKY